MGNVCLLCGSHRAPREYAKVGSWKYVACDDCSAVFLFPSPDQQTLDAYYNQVYTVPAEAYALGTKRNAQPILKILSDKIPSKGRLLEVGCSYGFFLHAARREGWNVAGIEINEAAGRYGRDKLQVEVLNGTLETAVGHLTPPYDAIAAFHVIEHVRDPLGFLAMCRVLLRRGGVLILKTPNVASWIARTTGDYWQWLSPPAHLHLFSPLTLRLGLEKSGFSVDELVSRRGDAHNNLFELLFSLARRIVALQDGPGNCTEQVRKRRGNTWGVNAARQLSELIYLPAALLLDPVLARKELQPELVAVARA